MNPVDRLKHARLWNKVARRQSLIRPAKLKPEAVNLPQKS